MTLMFGAVRMSGEAKNLSLRGAYFKIKRTVRQGGRKTSRPGEGFPSAFLGRKFKYRLVLSEANPVTKICGTGVIVRLVGRREAGVRFLVMRGDDLMRLRRVVELRSGDGDRIGKELKSFFK